MIMNNWYLKFLLTIATLTLLVEETSSDTSGGSCSAVSPAAEELRAKIEDLESKLSETKKEAGKLRIKIYELKKEVQKQTDEVSKHVEQRTELEETEKQCRTKLSRAIDALAGSNKENRFNRIAAIKCNGLKEKLAEDLKQLTAELEEARAGSCAGKPASTGQDLESLTEQLTNCGETVKVVRERCDRESNDLRRIEKTHERIRKGLENCTEKMRVCEGEKEHLVFLKKGYDVVVKQLEQETQEAKDGKERSDTSAKEAIRGASKYQFYLAGIAVLALTGGTILAYSFVKDKMAERLAALAAAKQKEKLETKKKGAPLSSRQKKKLS